jgi:hypothetical protein
MNLRKKDNDVPVHVTYLSSIIFSNFSAISWQEQANFQLDDDDDVRFVLDQHA